MFNSQEWWLKYEKMMVEGSTFVVQVSWPLVDEAGGN